MTGALPILIVLGLVVLVALVWLIVTFNRFVSLRQHTRNAWSQVEVELRRRYDLIPNLVETVKGYAAHEKDTLELVVELRNKAVASEGRPSEQAVDENSLVGALGRLAIVVENYPDLKADGQFVNLQRELADTEDRIAAARRFYNGNVRDLNTLCEMLPSNIVAGWMNVRAAEYFEIQDSSQRAAPSVSM